MAGTDAAIARPPKAAAFRRCRRPPEIARAADRRFQRASPSRAAIDAKLRLRGSARVWCQRWKAGVANEPFQRAEPPADIGVDEKAPHVVKQHEQGRHQRALDALRGAETQKIDRDQTAEPDERVVDRMGAGADQKIDVVGSVVHLVKAPQERDFVRPAVTPVEAEIGRRRRRRDRATTSGQAATAACRRHGTNV